MADFLASLVGPAGLAALGAFGLLLERLATWRANRILAKRAPVEAAASLTSAAATVAGTVEELLAPLRQEVADLRIEAEALRREVTALREVLEENGIPHPWERRLRLAADAFESPSE